MTETGHCDVCNKPFDVSSRADHCAECGNCFEHCTDRLGHELLLAAEEDFDVDDEEIGYCDVCNKPHENASRQDHCAECGNCFEHCDDREEHAVTLATEEAEAMAMSEEDAAEYIKRALDEARGIVS